MPYSEFQINRHIEILDEKAVKEVEGTSDEPELTTLYMIVETKEEVDKHTAKSLREKEFSDSAKLERESEE